MLPILNNKWKVIYQKFLFLSNRIQGTYKTKRKLETIENSVIPNQLRKTITWMSGSVGATFIKTSLLASNIPVRKPWLQYQANTLAKRTRNMTNNRERERERERERRYKDNLENCPRMAGIEPLYNPRIPICGSFEIISGKVSVDACTRV